MRLCIDPSSTKSDLISSIDSNKLALTFSARSFKYSRILSKFLFPFFFKNDENISMHLDPQLSIVITWRC